MEVISPNPQLPLYSLEADETGNKQFRVYNFEGDLPDQGDLLVPHRKDHYLLVFMRRGGSRHWIDMSSYVLKDNTIYFMGPNQVIVKEGVEQLWATGIAFTREFLLTQGNDALNRLPLIQNAKDAHELLLSAADVLFVEDILTKINVEYQQPGDWQQRMLSAHLVLLLTYLSRLYNEQFKDDDNAIDKLLLRKFQAKVDQCYHELHEVGDYASLLNISAGHLSEVVKMQSGKPAIKHIHDRLILEARRLLFHTNKSSKEIAYDLGFSDASYFNRFFKRETGITPSECRIAFRKMYH
ncbi:AraC family transcriptional regulator [Pedobacter sp. MC2016-14]|uniref:AraC family transcriptional regulator n=1 Tax=Pedobacter sp. MC2016-14 TaxID=2897327 RepID=UPI001E40B2B3|nr:AraC family transcriptional regulator [Pedobacter sp. MC2016-14]MCD0490065.1 AraC family transcriptional regulator [Pedobacter sp. MC2016-14]